MLLIQHACSDERSLLKAIHHHHHCDVKFSFLFIFFSKNFLLSFRFERILRTEEREWNKILRFWKWEFPQVAWDMRSCRKWRNARKSEGKSRMNFDSLPMTSFSIHNIANVFPLHSLAFLLPLRLQFCWWWWRSGNAFEYFCITKLMNFIFISRL